MAHNIEFKTDQNNFQKSLISDLKKIEPSKNIMILATKQQIIIECHQIITTLYLHII